MIKVAVVIDTWFPAIGGGQINAWEISKRLAKKGVKIDIITRNNGRDNLPKTKNIKIYKLGKISEPDNAWSKLAFIIQASNFLKNKNYDLIHAHPFLSVLAAKLISTIKKTPIILTVHGTRLFENRKLFLPGEFLEKLILTNFKYSLQVSVSKAFLKIKNVNKVIYVPNGVDYKSFEKVSVVRSSTPKILWVGRFDPIKRVEDLLFAMRIVEKSLPKAKLFLVGYGYQESRLKEIAKKLRLKNVRFMGKKVGKDLINQYKSAHLFVLPSLSEGQPLTILEAKAAGLPVIATKVGGISELLEPGKDSLISPKNPQILADAILSSLKKGLPKFSGNFLSKYNWTFSAKKTLDLYKKLT